MQPKHKTAAAVAGLIVTHISQRFLQEVDMALRASAVRAVSDLDSVDASQWRNRLGMERHFQANSCFAEVTAQHGCKVLFLAGGHIVLAQVGPLTVGRFNINSGDWRRVRTSSTRRHYAEMNEPLERAWLQPDLFTGATQIDTRNPPETSIFLVSCFTKDNPQEPESVRIVVPAPQFRALLLDEPLDQFCARYDVQPEQIDAAKPTLRSGVRRSPKTGTSDPSL